MVGYFGQCAAEAAERVVAEERDADVLAPVVAVAAGCGAAAAVIGLASGCPSAAWAAALGGLPACVAEAWGSSRHRVSHRRTLCYVVERTEVLHIRLKPESLQRLRDLAERERRTVSDMARLLLADGLDRQEGRRR